VTAKDVEIEVEIRDQCENDLGTITSIFLTEWMASEKGLI
jgi:hypothetical protein